MDGDLVDRLEELAAAHDRGEIDDDTFAAQKAELLQAAAPASAPPSSLLPPPSAGYPLRYDVAYANRLSRWKTLIRLPLLAPVWLFLYLVQWALSGLVLAGWTAVFWRKKYPAWAFQGAAGAMGFTARAFAYAILQTDRFPSFDPETSPVTFELDPPPSGRLSRWRVVAWKLILLTPQFVVLSFLQLALFVTTIIAWFAILFIGRYPRGLFPFATGVMRWHYRVIAYLASFNDRYPPYSLSASAGPAGLGATITSGVVGGFLGAGYTGLIILVVALGSRHTTVATDYARLQQGRPATSVLYHVTGGEVIVTLDRVDDPGESLVRVIQPAADERVVVFEWTLRNGSSSGQAIAGNAASLTASAAGKAHDYAAQFVAVDNRAAPADIPDHASSSIRAVFVIPSDADPVRLRLENGFVGRGIEYQFR